MPVHTYAEPGTYTACLLVWAWNPQTQDSCFADHCETVVITGGNPCDSLSACFEPIELPGGGYYFENCTGMLPGSQFFWDFGDGHGSNGLHAEHHYDQPGTYTVCLIAEWLNCIDTTCTTIVVSGDSLCDGLAVTMSWNQGSNNSVLFSGTANFAPDGYLWDYGDGEHGYDQTVTHTYDPGTYTACFSAYLWNEQAQDTCWAHTCQTVTITGGNPCDNLNAGFQVTTVGPVATFHSSNSTAQHYEWSFGDGTSGYGPMPVHTYAEPGTYTACLLAWAWNPQTQDTCYADHCETVVIAGGDPCDSLSACFEPIELPGGGYYFENCTGMLPGSQFFWDFGDGHGSNGLHAEHHYDQPGTYTVCLIAEWQNCIDTTCTLITVGATDPCAGLQAGFTWHTTPNGTLFSNSTTGTGFQTTFVWTFGDGSTSNDAQPFHTYAADGVYEACLQVISIFELPGGGVTTCVDDTCMTVVIGEPSPCDSLNAGFTASGGPGGVNFANAVIDPSWTYQWYFGDGTEGYGPNPYHTFPGAGTYQVCLVVSAWDPVAQDSCFANHCEMVVITGGNPCDNLNAGFQVTTDGPIATFHSSNSTDQQYEWHFGDGTIGYGPMPSHTYAGPGTYTACLLVWAWDPQTQDTCYADHCETVVILPTGLTEADARNDGISTWPQPFSNELTLSGDDLDGSYWITLLDMAGRIADDRQLTINGTVQLDYRAIPPGSYILRLQGASSVRTVRVLKY
jgi:PKD repeat protein